MFADPWRAILGKQQSCLPPNTTSVHPGMCHPHNASGCNPQERYGRKVSVMCVIKQGRFDSAADAPTFKMSPTKLPEHWACTPLQTTAPCALCSTRCTEQGPTLAPLRLHHAEFFKSEA